MTRASSYAAMAPDDYRDRIPTRDLRPGDAVLTTTYAHEALAAHRTTDPTLWRARIAPRIVAEVADVHQLTSNQQGDRIVAVRFTDGRRLTCWGSDRWIPAEDAIDQARAARRASLPAWDRPHPYN